MCLQGVVGWAFSDTGLSLLLSRGNLLRTQRVVRLVVTSSSIFWADVISQVIRCALHKNDFILSSQQPLR